MTRDELPPIFMECCSPPDAPGRYALHAPFWQRGYAYATDGRIIVRTPCDGFDCLSTVPDAHTLFGDFLASSASGPATQLPAPPKDLSTWITPPDVVTATCMDCGHEHECGNADPTPQPVEVGVFKDGTPAYLRAHYIITLVRNGFTEVYFGEQGRPARFCRGPIEGFVMPVEP